MDFTTRLSHVDGERGQLLIAGYAVEDLAPNATFEEVASLLLNDPFPTAPEHRHIPAPILDVLRQAAAANTTPIDALLMAAPLLRLDPNASPIAAFPTIVGAYHRLRQGLTPVPVNTSLPHAAHYLHQLTGRIPAPEHARAMETYLNTVCDHGLNASTFTARVIVSTQSDIVSAITGAVGALKGPLHGGAPGPALQMVFDIATPARAEPFIAEKLNRGERLMGFGHRIYRVRDPRADVLAAAAEQFFQSAGDRQLYDLARHVEVTALRLLRQHKPGHRIDTNVEFYTALLLHGLGIPVDLFTPTFAVGRVLGWTAHCREQLCEGRLIRPESRYIGPTNLKIA